ncbi:unnamed protein product [Macrosiphum euphorbiae]|nr:unnamed protein product [Macrosiphum euphorbiae]
MEDETIKYDIKVTNAFKKYGQNNVFDGLNMSVKSGSMKTFEYYGSLYRMSKINIKNKLNELNEFLKFPDLNSYLNEISGGQSRKVSFGISLLHDPKVMILDEPTVGIDPLLREGIWAELTKMAKEQKKTIIITTHYIEEANKSDCVGLMRNGLIIEEGPPQDILIKYGTDTLESAFLTLCCNQRTIIKKVDNTVQVKEKVSQKKILESGNFDLYRIKALLKKNYRVFSRDYLLLFTLILLPILQTFNFCFAIGVPFKGMKIAYKNDEINILDCQYSNVNGCIFDENSNQTMSCVIMNYLSSHDYELVEVQDREVAEVGMNHIEYIAFLYFPKNYTSGLTKYINDRQYFDLESIMFVHLTNENILFKNQITLDVLQSINYLIMEALNSCSNNPVSIGVPLEINNVVGEEIKSFANSTIALFIAMIAFYCPSVFVVSVMMAEKMDGLLSRSMFAGVKILELIISMLCITTVLLLFQMSFSCFISYILFLNPIQITNGMFVYALLLLLMGWLGFLFGLLTAVLSTTKLFAVYIITGSSMTQFLLSGSIWPLEGQPQLLRQVSKLLPIRLVGNIMNNIAIKGWTLDHPSIITETSLTVLYNILLILVLIVLGKIKKDLWVIQK